MHFWRITWLLELWGFLFLMVVRITMLWFKDTQSYWCSSMNLEGSYTIRIVQDRRVSEVFMLHEIQLFMTF